MRELPPLQPNEQVLWESRVSLMRVAVANAFLLLVALAFAGGGVAMTLAGRSIQASTGLFLWTGGVLTLAAAPAVFLVGRFVWLMHQATWAVYRITTRRVLCTAPALWGDERHSLEVKELAGWAIHRGWGGAIHLQENAPGEFAPSIHMVGVVESEAAFQALQLLQKGELAPIR